jgi:beta-glucosidase
MLKVKIHALLIIVPFLISSGCKHKTGMVIDEFERKADSIIRLMTLDEKVGQLTLFTSDWSSTGPSMRSDYADLIRQGKVGAIFNAYTVDYVKKLQEIAVNETRLHIPLMFGYDVIHGHRTIFPVPLAQASSWDTAMVKKSERIAAIEATAEGLNWTFAPMVDVSRDPRWGRVMEGAGEDTWLGSLIARARVKGFQGDSFTENSSLLACAKHFAAYGAAEAGRDYNPADISELSLYEYYLPVYKACVDAGVASVMTSFNEIAGVPSTSNRWLLTNLLRNNWNFKGFVVTDYTSINELIPHGVAKDSAQAGALSINAGVDMDMQGSIFLNKLPYLIGNKEVSTQTLNNAVRRILVAKFKLGLFDNPYKYCNKNREQADIMRQEWLDFARKFAANSCVLLKNENSILPLKNFKGKIAVIGPLADSKADMLGSWSAAGQSEKCVTLLEGIRNKATVSSDVIHAKGCNVNDNNRDLFSEAVSVASKADFVILALGESREMSGEAACRTDISLPGVQLELAKAVIKTGKPLVVVLFNGRPLTIPELDKIAPAILEAWFGGTQAGNGIADVLFGDVNPSGKLTMSFPRTSGQIPVYYNAKNTGRPVDINKPGEKYKSRYLDSPNSPLYPFGYGLSYSTFRYSDIRINKTEFSEKDQIIASVDITNTGKYDGEEVVQLYIQDLVGDVTRPVKELKGFRKVFLRSNETISVTFILTPAELAYYHQNLSFSYDPGDFELYIGSNSEEVKALGFRIL